MTRMPRAPLQFDALVARVRDWHAEGRRVVHCHGRFDLLHAGHIDRLETARREGDLLVVTVAPDRPDDDDPAAILPAAIRAQTLGVLPCVDAVAIAPTLDMEALLRTLKADVLVPAIDGLVAHSEATRELSNVLDDSIRTRVHQLHESTFRQRVIDEQAGSSEKAAFLRAFRRSWTADDVIARLRDLAGLRVLVLGDTIIDQYDFCRPYGMPLKSPIIAAQSLGREAYAGGALAVANHVANFCAEVDLVTVLGEEDTREDFIREHLRPNVQPTFFYRPGAPTTIKRRYVQRFLLRKLFEIAFFDDRPLPPEPEAELDAHLRQALDRYDLVIVADFGHGLMTPRVVSTVCERARFIALNTQLNSVNFGYHVVTRYPRADYVCIDEEETRLAGRDRFGPIQGLLPEIGRRLNCGTMTVTRGHHGSLTWTPDAGFVSVPVLSREVVDTIGAGDAYLAVSAPCVRAGFPPDLVGFVGNAVGAIAVRIVGNQLAVEQDALADFIRSTLR